MESKVKRNQALFQWLADDPVLQNLRYTFLAGEASFRRYYRVFAADKTFVLVDAPPAKENILGYIAIAGALKAQGLFTPEIIKVDVAQGFLLISDFGDQTYLKALTIDNADCLYKEALKSLSVLQSCQGVSHYSLSSFNKAFMWQEWASHKDWFLQQLLGLQMRQTEKHLDTQMDCLIEAICQQPMVFMHRDYHSGNLMWLANRQVGILDFQDAQRGPVTYDLVSLLRDCYVDWPESSIERWVAFYWQQLVDLNVLKNISFFQFYQWFDWIGIQRHLKALFIFARKALRDQQSEYLHHVPRTLTYLKQVSARYPELKYLHQFYNEAVSAKWAFLCVP